MLPDAGSTPAASTSLRLELAESEGCRDEALKSGVGLPPPKTSVSLQATSRHASRNRLELAESEGWSLRKAKAASR